MAGKVGAALAHFRRRAPVRPLGLCGDGVRSLPLEALLGGGDAIHHRLAVTQHIVEPVLSGVDDDVARRNTIINLLSDWGLLTIVDKDKTKEPVAPMRLIKVIPFKQKNEWQLVAKYNIGRSKIEDTQNV